MAPQRKAKDLKGKRQKKEIASRRMVFNGLSSSY